MAHLATFPAREDVLRSNLPRLRALFSKITICLNEYSEVPEYLKGDEGIVAFIPSADLKDIGKFVWPVRGDESDFLIDDDIVYPPDYVQRMTDFASSWSGPAVFGLHGVIYRSWYHGGFRGRKLFPFGSAVETAGDVDVLGTGTVMLTHSSLPPLDYMAGSAGFVDIRFARYCAERGVRRICVPRPASWLRESPVRGPTIFDTYTRRARLSVWREVNRIRSFRVSSDAGGEPE